MTLIDHRDPLYESELDIPGFTKFIEDMGGEVRAPTNEWEVLRYTWAGTGVHIIYKNKRSVLNYTNDAREHYQQFAATLPPQPEAQFKMRVAKPRTALDTSTIDPTILEKWGRVETDPSRQSAEHRPQSEDGGVPPADHSEDVPW